jgi:hypothetical protein
MLKVLKLCTLYLNRAGMNLPCPGNLNMRRTASKVIKAKLADKNIWFKYLEFYICNM